MTPNGTSAFVAVLELLLQRAHKLIIVGLVVFFLGPTIGIGWLVWRLVDREDHVMSQQFMALNQHAIIAQEHFTIIEKTLLDFISAQRDIENQRNELLFEMCLEIANDGPGRARCRQAIGR